MTETILTNARIVLPNGEINGSLILDNGLITEISSRNYTSGIDLQGAILIPGIIDIHTDYLERELSPRPSARFPLELALHVMDMRAITCGLTTVCSAARISAEREGPAGSWRGDGLQLALRYEELIPQLRARHLIHVRWSTNFDPVEHILEQMLNLKSIGNLVFNDDMPGERQFRDVEALIRQYATRQDVSFEEARKNMDERIARARETNNRVKVNEFVAGRIPIGSHDDTTIEHVIEAHEAGAALSEMPCSIEAARKAKELGMMVCMGAPNYYRGGSHCGNLSCHEALAENLVDILCSDYHFPSLLACVSLMTTSGMSLSSAVNLITLNPARHLGLDSKLGSIEPGKQGDLVAFHPSNGYSDVVRVWVDGQELFSALPRPTEHQSQTKSSLYQEESSEVPA